MNWKTLRPIAVSGTTLLVVFLITAHEVDLHRKPGSMTVIEAQSMDMNAVSANTPVGAIPVASETVKAQTFAPTVTYTGTVMAYGDIDVYPRVPGVVAELKVYPGDRVRAGQAIARLDSAELASRADEAASEQTVMRHDVVIAGEDRRAAAARERSAAARESAARESVAEAASQVDSALAARDQAIRERDAASAVLASAWANVTAAAADADYWKAELARETEMYRIGVVSRQQFEKETAQAKLTDARLVQARAAVDEKAAMLETAKSAIDFAGANVTTARVRVARARADAQGAAADVDVERTNQQASAHRVQHHQALVVQAAAQRRTAEIVRGYTEIRAERGGVVTERLISPGTLVQPGTAILKIKSDDQVRIQANVAESDLAGIRVGSSVAVTAPLDRALRLTSRVTSIFSSANQQTRTVTVEALTPNRDHRLLSGEYVLMEIATAIRRMAIAVPSTAVHRDVDQQPYVWTVAIGVGGKTLYTCVMHPQIVSEQAGKCPICAMPLVPKDKSGKFVAHRTFVTLGPSDSRRSVVERGLHAGDRVIYRGEANLNEGDPVMESDDGGDGPRTSNESERG